MEHRSALGVPLTSVQLLPNKHLVLSTIRSQMKTQKQYSLSSQELPGEQTERKLKNEKYSSPTSSPGPRNALSLPRKKSSESDDLDQSNLITAKSKSVSALPTTPTHLSLPMKLAKLSLNAERGRAAVPKILINDEVEPRKDIDSMPRRPLKRKSQDHHDRNFLSEAGYAGSIRHSSDFWLPKVKVTPSMVNQLNAEILANIHLSSSPSIPAKADTDDKDRAKRIVDALQTFFITNQVFGAAERIIEAVETLSTRILNPSDDEAWTILTSEQVLSVEFPFVGTDSAVVGSAISNVRIRARCPIAEIRRILTDPEQTVVHLVGPEIEIVFGESVKTEKVISSILVSALRLSKSVPMEMDAHNQCGPSRSARSAPSPQFLEVTHVPILELPNIKHVFQTTYPDANQVFHSSVVVISFEEMAREIEVPVRIQVTSEGADFRPSVLKLVGPSLSFCNPMRSFFAFNPGRHLTNIDVSNRSKFSMERIESPKPNSLLMVNNGNYYIIETGDGRVAEEIYQRISMIQNICSNGIGKQVAHVFITPHSILALKCQTYESIFQEPVMNIVKIHTPETRGNTCVLELESTEAMDFISSDSPCWSLTFPNSDAKSKFMERLLLVAPSPADDIARNAVGL